MNRPHILLVNPKYELNVAKAYRSAALWGARTFTWTGDRVDVDVLSRVPREERFKPYRDMTRLAWACDPVEILDEIEPPGFPQPTPVCVEIVPGTTSLFDFVHPVDAVYIFGPEDGSVPARIRAQCHAFVRVPVWQDDIRTPFNLAQTVHSVLQDRILKRDYEVTRRAAPEPTWQERAIAVLNTR